ncbi:hypothetical protein ACFOZ0_09470 [Streptomyces yaanensis]|uniref:Uncharacterized protein n=1 Tax=Streptomyces yaanensis TaxID=1142239 RepID=A0ABV7S906_9ACTN|nr:hypothetical protein [Streptomyces sp. CGMCC 4.7035]WNB96591.1 hypothetical protein Q2K21_00060 [Streptomyces sp. CGMCC 4.7035]
MGRRTQAGCGAVGHGRTPARAAVALCVAAALGVTVTLPARAAPVFGAAAGTPSPYAFARDAGTVEGATGTTDAVRLDPGRTYRSTLPADGKRYYRLELDAAAGAYVSATAVPRAGARVSSSDGLKVSLQDADGTTCSSRTTHFGPTQSPHPIVAWASRETGPGTYVCKRAGAYYVVVEQRDLDGTESGDWDLELDYVSEPALRQAGATTPPGDWNSATPEAVLGDATRRSGGAGFSTASALGQGVWQDTIRPGQTLFYKVPVDWGQQLSATVEMGSSTSGEGYIGTALAMSLYNPVRAYVGDADAGYSGAQTSAALDPLPPVAYANRHAIGNRASGMRFAGWYYLALHLGAPVAGRFGEGPFGLTLRVRVSGTAASGPAYAGRSAPRDVFEVTAADREEAAAGRQGGGARDGSAGPTSTGDTPRAAAGAGVDVDTRTMKLVAVGGIGAGSLLVLWLGVWSLAARRRARRRWAG